MVAIIPRKVPRYTQRLPRAGTARAPCAHRGKSALSSSTQAPVEQLNTEVAGG